MALLKQHKVNSLPGTLEANSIYYVLGGGSFTMYITNSGWTIEAKSLVTNNFSTMVKTTNQSITGTAAQIPATELANRKSIVITNESTTESIRVGDSTVSASKGTLIKPGQTMAFDLDTGLHAIRVGATSANISINEFS